ncbi:DUF2690 domain-containing protein [Streptomyces coeruleoprunus]|uniref:DUF2690 domain-containing protein n=1 Tax=Streptomyces coeruleoprunus TaxID=285563 RepID=A0ABV9XHG9_9ACTN
MIKKVLGTTLAAFALAALLPAGAAQAATCKGSSCLGKNPQTAGCGADAVTLKGSAIRPAGGGPAAVIRNSSTCGAAWARIEKANSAWRFKIEIKGGKSYLANANPNHEAYTLMVPSSTAYRTCVEIYDGAGGSWSCTKWF